MTTVSCNIEVTDDFDKNYFSRVAPMSNGSSTIVGSRDNRGEQMQRVITEKFFKICCFKGKKNGVMIGGWWEHQRHFFYETEGIRTNLYAGTESSEPTL